MGVADNRVEGVDAPPKKTIVVDKATNLPLRVVESETDHARTHDREAAAKGESVLLKI